MKYETMTFDSLTEVLASNEPVPGGGSASALVGAIGVALGNMVGSLTVGKKRFEDVRGEIEDLMREGEKLRRQLLFLVNEDAKAFAPLAKAYSIPKDEPGRTEIMEKALFDACQAPLDIMRVTGRAIEVIDGLAKLGSHLVISDAGVGVECCKAALKGASLNVMINTRIMKDREMAEKINKEASFLLNKYKKLADEIYDVVLEKLK